MHIVNMSLKVDDYTSRVLGVIKEKFGLKDKSEALIKFAHDFGDEFVEKELREDYAKELLKSSEEHYKKYPNRRMSLKELDELMGIKSSK